MKEKEECKQHMDRRLKHSNVNKQPVMHDQLATHDAALLLYVRKQRYAEAVLYIERKLMDGERFSSYVTEEIPQHYYYQSPFVMQAFAELQWHEGALPDAKLSAEYAVKGFAALYMPQHFLASLARLGHIFIRIGQFEAAGAIATQLIEEIEREPLQEAAGEMLQFLALSLVLLPSSFSPEAWKAAKDPSTTGIQLLQTAIDRFERRGLLQEACLAAIDMAWHYGARLDKDSWRKYDYQCELWCHLDRQLNPYKLLFELLQAYYEKQWLRAAQLEESLQQLGTEFPYYINGIRAMIHLYGANEQMVSTDQHRAFIQHCIDSCPMDMQLQYELKLCLLFDHYRLHKQAVHLEQQVRLIAKWLCCEQKLEQQLTCLKSSKADAVSFRLSSERYSDDSSERTVTDSLITPKAWRLCLFDGLRLSREQEEKRQLLWKRKKSKELLIYLALQPHYTAVREQIIEALQLGEQLDKAVQQLYVIVHQLKRTLQQELGIEQAVLVKDGFIRLSEEAIDYVDVEHYLTLIRIADQLWQEDKGLSYEMYEDAYLLYGELLPELSYEEWLERIREHLVQKHILLLKRCMLYTELQQDWPHMEIYIRSWLELDPFHEEAHARLIELLMKLGRHNEAKNAYAAWKQRCTNELGIEPSFTLIM